MTVLEAVAAEQEDSKFLLVIGISHLARQALITSSVVLTISKLTNLKAMDFRPDRGITALI
ncbi:hypothetical protein EON65_53885 [archaeon]|nr:MAG: hypothetical protein EON65_53885 [archaeon]